jgi:hypothetical protein
MQRTVSSARRHDEGKYEGWRLSRHPIGIDRDLLPYLGDLRETALAAAHVQVYLLRPRAVSKASFCQIPRCPGRVDTESRRDYHLLLFIKWPGSHDFPDRRWPVVRRQHQEQHHKYEHRQQKSSKYLHMIS